MPWQNKFIKEEFGVVKEEKVSKTKTSKVKPVNSLDAPLDLEKYESKTLKDQLKIDNELKALKKKLIAEGKCFYCRKQASIRQCGYCGLFVCEDVCLANLAKNCLQCRNKYGMIDQSIKLNC